MNGVYKVVVLFLSVSIGCLWIGWSVSAEESTRTGEASRFIGKARAPLCSTPGGPRRAELFVSTPVEIIGEKGEWVQVNVQGWVQKYVLRESQGAKLGKDGSLVEQGDRNFVVESFDVSEQAGDSGARILLKLKLRNNSKSKVTAWTALLVAQSSRGDVLFREPITQDNIEIAPGGLHDVSFYWNKGEAPYDALIDGSRDGLKLQLFRVSLK